jgi:ribosomal protein L37AE/L43A
MVSIVVRYETNYTETTAGASNQSYYAVEQWEFQRRLDVLSPEPEQIAALHCPKCGGSLEKRSDGACAHCGVKVVSGDFHWYVTAVSTLERDPRGPLLTTDVPEVGTDLPTVFDPGLTAAHQALEAAGNFSWDRAQERFGHIFMGVQQAWTMLKPDVARPFETDNIYDMHRYWIEAYQRQNLRNVLDRITIESITPVKIQSDRFYDAMTVRIFADMLDYTVNAQGQGVCGSSNRPRRFSEYWTFIRRQGSKENARDNNSCPNCGAPLKINMAGACEYCGGKITRGDFDWVLSRIEQDEAYVG